MEKEYIYRTDDNYEFNTLKEALKHAELHEECSLVTQYNILSEDDYEEPKQVWVRESKLNEATSNFGRLKYLPLLIFYRYDDVVDTLKYNSEYPDWDDFDTTSEYYDAVEEFEEKFLDNFEYPILYEDDLENLENDLELFNSKTAEIAEELDIDENGYQKYENNLDLKDIELEPKPGYYEANYIDCNNEDYFDNLDKEVREEQIKRFNDFLKELKSKYNLTQLGVTGTFSNGETIYHKVESLKEDEEKKDTIYYCLSDRKMPKHSILLYGEEGKDKLLEIAPKYLEYYGQAEIFKSVNGNQTVIWRNGELLIDESLKEAFNGEEVFVHVFDIDYFVTEEDVDNESEIEEIKASLPQDLYFSFEEYFEDDYELEESIADAISDETGWLVETFDYELLSEEEYNHYSQLKEAKKKKEKVRFVGNPEKEMAFFNHAMGSDAGAAVGEAASNECKLKESRDDKRVAHYQALLDELYVTPKETELILKTADEYENTAQRGWISFDEADKVTEKLDLKHLSRDDLSRMWEVVYYTLEKAAFENDGENYEKYSDAASAFAEVINMEARRRKEHEGAEANLEDIVGDRFSIDNDGLLYLYTSAMKDIIAWAKHRGKSIDELLEMSLTKEKDSQTGTLRLKDYSIEFKRLWDQVREEVEDEVEVSLHTEKDTVWKDFDLEAAIKVAKEDYNIGVMAAIETLEDLYRFDCSDYWSVIDRAAEEDPEHYDEINLQARDELYKKLGIEDLMNQAYAKVWNK